LAISRLRSLVIAAMGWHTLAERVRPAGAFSIK
jgi:hypothetical protein